MRANEDLLDTATSTAHLIDSANRRAANDAVHTAAALRRSALAASAAPAKAQCAEDLVGTWRVAMVEVFNAQMHCEAESFEGWYLEFSEDGQARVCLYGNVVEASYHVADGYVGFGSSELASLRLEAENGRLRLAGLGMKFTFAPEG